jgi:hypothetical protein
VRGRSRFAASSIGAISEADGGSDADVRLGSNIVATIVTVFAIVGVAAGGVGGGRGREESAARLAGRFNAAPPPRNYG